MKKTYWKKFKSMGTEVILNAYLDQEQVELLDQAETFVCDFSIRFSRFSSDNELADFNNADGKNISVSGLMLEMILAMKKINLETEGIFDPTVIGSLQELGYNKDFGLFKEGGGDHEKINLEKISKQHFNRPSLKDLKISSNIASIPKGFQLDFGGIGKGFLVDYLAENFLKRIDSYWISAGGDLIVSGNREGGRGWEIGVQNPSSPEESVFDLKTNGEKISVATSSVIKRKWQKGEEQWHHIIDPRTGLSVKNNILSITVVAPSAMKADVYAKTMLILGEKSGLEFIEKQVGSAGIIFPRDKNPIFSKGISKYLR